MNNINLLILINTLAIMISLTENEYLQGVLYGYEVIVMIVLFKDYFKQIGETE